MNGMLSPGHVVIPVVCFVVRDLARVRMSTNDTIDMLIPSRVHW